MDPLSHQIAERSIDQSLPFDAALPLEGVAFDSQGKVALALGIVAAVPKMLFGLVDKLDSGGRKRRLEPTEHFSRDRTGSQCVHRPYI